MTIYDDLVNALICVMRDNATASNKCLACSKKGKLDTFWVI